MSLQLRDGKFFRDGIEEPLKFGDIEQIALMNKKLKHFNALKGDGLEIDPDVEATYKANIYFDCLCGKRVFHNVELDDEDSLFDISGEVFKCHHCNEKYIIAVNDDDNLVVKIRT